MTIEEAGKILRAFLEKSIPNVHVGIGDTIIYVYLVNKKYQGKVPPSWEGFPVKTIVTGQMKPC